MSRLTDPTLRGLNTRWIRSTCHAFFLADISLIAKSAGGLTDFISSQGTISYLAMVVGCKLITKGRWIIGLSFKHALCRFMRIPTYLCYFLNNCVWKIKTCRVWKIEKWTCNNHLHPYNEHNVNPWDLRHCGQHRGSVSPENCLATARERVWMLKKSTHKWLISSWSCSRYIHIYIYMFMKYIYMYIYI